MLISQNGNLPLSLGGSADLDLITITILISSWVEAVREHRSVGHRRRWPRRGPSNGHIRRGILRSPADLFCLKPQNTKETAFCDLFDVQLALKMLTLSFVPRGAVVLLVLYLFVALNPVLVSGNCKSDSDCGAGQYCDGIVCQPLNWGFEGDAANATASSSAALGKFSPLFIISSLTGLAYFLFGDL